MIGIEIDGRYRVEQLIGRGGFGSVYRALDLSLKRPVALKILTELSLEENVRKRVELEMISLAKLNHPNIVSIYDCGEYENKPYMVMELVTGMSLQDLADGPPLSPNEVCSMSLQVCRAMAYAHDQGIIHRDLTLKNIMIQMDSEEKVEVKIVDFGLAKLLHSEMQTTGQAIMGTPRYISPEQIRGQSVDGRADIFAFGVGLYRIVNGRFPFDSEHPTAVMYQIVNKQDIEFIDNVPEGLRDIIHHCMEKSPEDRPDGFQALADRFQDLLGANRVQQTTRSITVSMPLARGKRGGKRNPYLNRVMIKDPQDFFGREREIRKIYSRLDAPQPQSISIVGERRIGKSSLLNYIYHRGNRRKNMQNHDSAIFIYLDFQGRADFDAAGFIDFLFNVFSYETRAGKEFQEGERSLDRLKSAVERLHAEGRRIILLMDEFELITRNPNFDASFFSFLRSLANSYRMAYVTASCDELQLMCHNKDISDSPFFNIFSNLPLRPFTREAAARLIAEPSQAEGVPLEKYAPEIIEMAGYFPLFLQIACSSVFEHLVDSPQEEPDWSRVAATFHDEIVPHFDFVWERMDETEKENLRRMAGGAKISRKFKFVNEVLIRRGYLIEANGQLRIFSGAFKDYILREGKARSGSGSFLKRLFGLKKP